MGQNIQLLDERQTLTLSSESDLQNTLSDGDVKVCRATVPCGVGGGHYRGPKVSEMQSGLKTKPKRQCFLLLVSYGYSVNI